MNEAIFIERRCNTGNEVLARIKIIQSAQNDISDALRSMEVELGTIEFIKKEDTYKPVLTVDEKILDECCEKISRSIHGLKEAYEQLIEMGILKIRARNPGSGLNCPRYQQSH